MVNFLGNRTRLTSVCLVIVFFMCFATFGSQYSSATTVWSDNFDDGDYDDWTVLAGTVSASEFDLRVASAGYAVAYRNSSVVSGTWSFDLDFTTDIDDIQICFITKYIDDVYVRDNYLIENNGDDTGFRLVRWIWTGSAMQSQILDTYIPSGGIAGWHHFDITRNPSGEFNVYLNGTHIMDATDTTVYSSSCFVFNIPVGPSGTGPAIDNIVVTDSVDISPPTPTTTSETSTTTESANTTPSPTLPDMTMILLFGGVAIIIIVIAVVMKRK